MNPMKTAVYHTVIVLVCLAIAQCATAQMEALPKSAKPRIVLLTDMGGDRDVDQSFTGTISYISEIANAQTRSTRVEMTLDNAKQLLRSGQIVRIELTRRNLEQAIMIPLRAVIPMEEGHAVYVVEGSQSQRRLVTMGILQGDQIQITTGLQAGDQLIVKGQRFVAPGQPVTRVSESQ